MCYMGWFGSILQIRTKVGSKSWLITCSSNITLSLPSYTGSALKRELNFCNSYLSLLYFCLSIFFTLTSFSSSSSSSELFVSFSFWESMIKIFYDTKKNRCSVYKIKKKNQHWRFLLENECALFMNFMYSFELKSWLKLVQRLFWSIKNTKTKKQWSASF